MISTSNGRQSSQGGGSRRLKKAPSSQQYQFGEIVGKGASAVVFRALDTQTGQTVAVKYIDTRGMGADELKGLMGEIDLLRQLRHPNIVGLLKCNAHRLM